MNINLVHKSTANIKSNSEFRLAEKYDDISLQSSTQD
jgi:hypothetical protein